MPHFYSCHPLLYSVNTIFCKNVRPCQCHKRSLWIKAQVPTLAPKALYDMDPSYHLDLIYTSFLPCHSAQDTSLLAFLQTCLIQHLCICYFPLPRTPFFQMPTCLTFSIPSGFSLNDTFSMSFSLIPLSKRWSIPCALPSYNLHSSMITAHTYLFTYLLIICLPQEKFISLRSGIFDFLIANSPTPGQVTVY